MHEPYFVLLRQPRRSIEADFHNGIVPTFKELPHIMQATIEQSHQRGTGRPFTVEYIAVRKKEIEVLTVS